MSDLTPHPAKFTDVILEKMNEWLVANVERGGVVLDVFAGTGRIHLLRPYFYTVGVELEECWARHSVNGWTVVGDARDLPLRRHSVDAAAFSPVYGNRMSDHHNARDESKRHTYTHYKGAPLREGNAGTLYAWQRPYWDLHFWAYAALTYTLKIGAPVLCNVSNFIRKGKVENVVSGHKRILAEVGMTYITEIEVETPRQRHGANGNLRVDTESILIFENNGPSEVSKS